MSITEQLKQPFDPNVIHWRTGATNAKKLGVKPWEATKGIALAYIDARDVMKRFDDVCGDLWQVEYPFDGCCRIGGKIGLDRLAKALGIQGKEGMGGADVWPAYEEGRYKEISEYCADDVRITHDIYKRLTFS